MSSKKRILALAVLALLIFSELALAQDDAKEKAVKVFILAGQSNMEGKAKISLLEHQLNDPETQKQFAHLKKDGKWVERDDVWISYLSRRGKLSVGYGSNKERFGPELEFGHVLGNHFKEQVLIIKTAWGGKSLAKDFLPPSAGEAGPFYKKMNEHIHETLKNIKKHFPEYQGQGTELCGFVWFQGWNDMINPQFTESYTNNLACFIRDVRKQHKAPNLPFVIGQMGVGGKSVNKKMQRFKEAQAAVAALIEFEGTIALVKTDEYWDERAHAVFKKGWRKHLKEWEKVGSDYPFHYLGSCLTFSKIGRGFGEAMLRLLGEDKK